MEADWDEVRTSLLIRTSIPKYALSRSPRYFPYINPITNTIPGFQLQRITVPPPDVHAEPTPASTVAFDTQQELLWVGSEYVSVCTAHVK